MPKRIYKTIPLSEEAREAINGYCEEHGLNFAEETRNYWFRKIGRSDLKNETKMGRPLKQVD
jgi:hypothetical protein